ncbi:hypothetical protein EON66_06995 [archaeon]|nr:MAG: hypothetical protein EON66_06995 [archaeon]
MRADFSGHLRKADATHLLNMLHYFYFKDARWVELFNREPSKFDFNAYLREFPAPPAMKDVAVDRDDTK